MLSMIDADKEYQMHEKGAGNSVWKNKEWLWDADVTEDEVLCETGEESAETPGNDIDKSILDEMPGDDNGGSMPEWLTKIRDIDIEKGVSGMGSVESYLSVLGTFRKTAGDKADEIEKLYADGDIENYTIKVHALKSSARIIGADELSEMARRLELAGKEGDTDTISRDTNELLRVYRELRNRLAPLDVNEEKKKV